MSSTLSLIVHVRELTLPSNTAQFLQMMLPGQTHFDIRGRLNEPFDPAPVLGRPGRALFLYPDEKALELNEDFKANHPGPYHLIVPDGSWHQARKVHAREEAFHKIPTVKLPEGFKSEYQLRVGAQPHFLSTFEAVAHSLGILENQKLKDELMTLFKVFVKSVMHSRKNFHGKLELS